MAFGSRLALALLAAGPAWAFPAWALHRVGVGNFEPPMPPPRLSLRFVALAVALLGFGCAHTEAHGVVFDAPQGAGGVESAGGAGGVESAGGAGSTGSANRPGQHEGVVVFASRAPAGGRELGEVHAHGGVGVKDNDVRDLYEILLSQTRSLGGNALVIESMSTHMQGVRPAYSNDRVNPACNAGCTRGVPPKRVEEVMTVELRGKALWLSPEELEKPSLPRAP